MDLGPRPLNDCRQLKTAGHGQRHFGGECGGDCCVRVVGVDGDRVLVKSGQSHRAGDEFRMI